MSGEIPNLESRGPRTHRETEDFKKYIGEKVLADGNAEIQEFTKGNLRSFVNEKWGKLNQESFAKYGGVQKLQELLNLVLLKEKGQKTGEVLEGGIDGNFGIRTLAALINFQNRYNLTKKDGIAGEEVFIVMQDIISGKRPLYNQKEIPVVHEVIAVESVQEPIKILPPEPFKGVVRDVEIPKEFPGFPEKIGKDILRVIANPRYINYENGAIQWITTSTRIEDIVEPLSPELYIKIGSSNTHNKGLQPEKNYRLVWDIGQGTYVFHKQNKEFYPDFPAELIGKGVKIENGDQIIPHEKTEIAGRKSYLERNTISTSLDLAHIKGMSDNLAEDDRDYFYTYLRKTQDLSIRDFPESAKPLLDTFGKIDRQTILNGISGFPDVIKQKIVGNIGLIQRTAVEGVKRSARSILENEGYALTPNDALTVHITNRDRLLSFSITYNPIDKKLYVVPAGIGINGFGNDVDSNEMPLGTRRVTHPSVGGENQIMNPKESGLTSMRYAATYTNGIEKGLNSVHRDVVTHGVAPERGSILKTAGKGLSPDEMRRGSWGCTTMEGRDSQKIIGIYRNVIARKGRVYQETMPPIYFGGPIFTSDIAKEQNIFYTARVKKKEEGKKVTSGPEDFFKGIFGS